MVSATPIIITTEALRTLRFHREEVISQFYPESDITAKIIGAAIEVHKLLGAGLLESAYQACLAHELALQHIPFEKEKELPIQYKCILHRFVL